MKSSKTQEALKMVTAGISPYAAAREVGLAPSVVYRALARRREAAERICPGCGQVVRAGFAVKPMPAAEPSSLPLRSIMLSLRAALRTRDATTVAVIKRELGALLHEGGASPK